MISWQHEHHRLGIPPDELIRRQRDRRCSIPGFRLNNEIILQLIFPFTQLKPNGFSLRGSG